MATILVKNMRAGGGLMLNAGKKQITVPGGTMGPAGFAPGTATVDASFIEAISENPVVQAMIESGDLAIEGGEIQTLILPPDVQEEIEREEAERHAAMQAALDAEADRKAAEEEAAKQAAEAEAAAKAAEEAAAKAAQEAAEAEAAKQAADAAAKPAGNKKSK